MLFKELGKAFPKAEAENIRALLAEKMATNSNVYPDLFQHLYHNFDSHDIGRGINYEVMVDFLGFLDLFSEPAKIGKMTPRSISILLYRDSKRLEQVLSLCGHLIPEEFEVDLSPLLRSYPETYLSGKFRFAYKNKDEPMINPYGHAIGMYYKHIEAIQEISLVTIKLNPRVLSIENKETYFALASRANFDEEDKLSQFDCFLYTGGYPNRAVTSLIKILASSGFSLYHAGDLDPDGILILQRIQEIAGKEVIPHRMDRETFDTYSTWAKPLPATVLSQLKKINKETTAIPGIQGLINKIEESGTGVEQEIIDYR
ncbi:MAG: DUF2399 domain-containing protein [Treponema sp.]|nr:DUF2399 domain-containing protein [Treponema sp.]